MGFFRTAWHAGADQYGRSRAEQYGRRARAGRLVAVLAIVMLVIGIVVAVQGGLGG